MAVASENAWPRKGDTVYISASYEGLSAASPVADAQMKYDLPPCMKLELVKSKPKTLKWVTKDPIGGSEKLEGAWLSHTHQTKAECESQVSSDGEPTVVRSGTSFKIAPDDSQ
jgi:hypothetical protein